jgi:hypothetical protein
MKTRPENSKFICVQSSCLIDKAQSWEEVARHIHFESQKIKKEKTQYMERTAINRAMQLVREEIGKQDKDLSALYVELIELLEVERQHLEQAYRWGFTDGTRYTNGVPTFYVTANHYFTKNHLQ